MVNFRFARQYETFLVSFSNSVNCNTSQSLKLLFPLESHQKATMRRFLCIQGRKITLLPKLSFCFIVAGCDISSNPLVNATGWLRNEKSLSQSGPVLVLEKVSIQDVGWYQCTSQFLGETFSSIGYFLNVHPEQKVIEEKLPEDESLLTEEAASSSVTSVRGIQIL